LLRRDSLAHVVRCSNFMTTLRVGIFGIVLVSGCIVGSGQQQSGGDDDSKADNPYSTTGNAPFTFHSGREASGGFDVSNAYELARLCDLSYGNESAVGPALADRGIDLSAGHFRAFSDSSTHAYAFYVETQGAAFVVFRGTDDWLNWSQDAEISPSVEVIGLVHVGFQMVLDAVWRGQGLADYVRQRQAANPSLPLYVTGQSMGASLATIATARALYESPTISVAAVYALASPRAGNVTFSNELADGMSDSGTFFARVVNQCDPVTNVPVRSGPPTYEPFYEHVSLGFDENDFVYWLPSSGPVTRSIPLTACPPAGYDFYFSEHAPMAYVEALAKQL
jgi:hypothetical protein